MILLIYITKSIFISGGLLGYYWLFLRNRPFHGFNRFFLLSIPVLSLLVPVLHISPPSIWNHTGQTSAIHLLGVAQGSLEEAVTIYASHKKGLVFTWESAATMISTGISLVLAIGLIRSIHFLWRLRKNNPFLLLPGATLYLVSAKGTPFSFFKSIFWGKDMEQNSPEGKQILRHELFHVVQKHSLDILLMEICTVLFWFNPFLHILRTELKLIHEYAADAHATTDADGYAYAKLLLMHLSGTPVALAHPFFKNQIKRRITMITTNNKNKKTLLGRFMILPLLFIFICLFSFKLQNKLSQATPANVRVVIDPGHGGAFNGTSFNGIYEKNINLNIAKKIQALSKDYHVDVIMTREKDEDAAGNNLDASLQYRAGLASAKNADLFISIHVNGTGEPGPQKVHSGFEIYVPDNSNQFHSGSVKLASTISEYIKPDYTIAAELKERDGNVRILNQATVPAILIECGYIDNESDLAWMQDEKNQEKIARDILEGIQKYGRSPNAYVPHENRQRTEILAVNENQSLNNNIPANKNPSVNRNSSVNENQSLNQNLTVNENQSLMEIQSLNQNLPDSSSPHKKVEVEAEYPGGSEAWVQYLIKKCVYPPAAEKNGVQGEVQVEFVVNTSGKISGVRAISGPEVLRSESVRLIKESGKWTAAKDKGKKVASYKIQPINFRLEEH